jgi:hypothetical protein
LLRNPILGSARLNPATCIGRGLVTDRAAAIAWETEDIERRFDAFVVSHRDRAVRLAWRLVGGDDAAAQDVTQDAFVSAYRSLATFRGDAQLSTSRWRRVSLTLLGSQLGADTRSAKRRSRSGSRSGGRVSFIVFLPMGRVRRGRGEDVGVLGGGG